MDAEIRKVTDDAGLFWFLIPMLLWLLAGYEWWGRSADLDRQPVGFAIAALGMSVLGAFRIRRARDRLENLRLGLAGERLVGQMLDELRVNGARILHDVQGEGFNIDHLVISPRGLYCIETKTYSKPRPNAKIKYDGQHVFVDGHLPDRDPIQQVLAAAQWLERQITASTGKHFQVRPVVLFPQWWIEAVPGARGSKVWVLEPKALTKWIENALVTIVDSDVTLVSYHVGQMIKAGEKEALGL